MSYVVSKRLSFSLPMQSIECQDKRKRVGGQGITIVLTKLNRKQLWEKCF